MQIDMDMAAKWTNWTSAFFLRLAIAVSYLWEVADRLGWLGRPGRPHVGWGDWKHFIAYATQVLSFLPLSRVPIFAGVATAAEAIIGLLLFFGLFSRFAAVASALLSMCFALSMTVSFGIESPLGYSVFTLCAASGLLAGQPVHTLSMDYIVHHQKTVRQQQSLRTGSSPLRKTIALFAFLFATTCTSLRVPARASGADAGLEKIIDAATSFKPIISCHH